MNIFDIAILLILAAFLVKGLLRGLVRELCTLLGFGSGALIAFGYHLDFGNWMANEFSLPAAWCQGLAFVVLFLTALLLFGMVGLVLTRYVKLLYVGGLNRVIGGLLGLVQGMLLLSVVLYALSIRDLPGGLNRQLDQATLSPPFVDLGEIVFEEGWDLFQEV